MTTYNYPIIVVERPHQTPGKAWTARSDDDIIGCLARADYGDGWDYERIDCLAELADIYGDDRDDWPEDARGLTASDFPLIHTTGPWGHTYLPPNEAGTELEFAVDYIGHDFHGLDILESPEEAEELMDRAGHNIPYNKIREAMADLDWQKADNPQ